MKLINCKIVSLLFLLVMVRCSDPVSGGGGSETTNSFTASFDSMVIHGKGIPGYSVEVYPTNYRPYSKMNFFQTEIGIDGEYSLSISDSGKYNIFSLPKDSTHNLALIIDTVVISPDIKSTYSKGYSVSGLISIQSDTNNTILGTYVLYLMGTPFRMGFSKPSDFPLTIKNVPESGYRYNCEKVGTTVSMKSDTVFFSQISNESSGSVKVDGKINTVIKVNSNDLK